MPTSVKKLNIAKEPQLGYNLEARTLRVKAKPFIKWAGGKGQLLSSFAAHFPPTEKIGRYFEPFMGGAAVFFHLQPQRSFLSDSNSDLVDLYTIVRDDVETLIDALKSHRNKETYYYKIRAQNPATLSPVERAARLIFLNKTCYNGLYRVNSNGGFNVPFGNYLNPNICDAENLRAASLALQYAEICQSDFEQAVSSAKKGDFVYFDPPYQPISRTSSFTSYTSGRFDDSEQERLANVFRSLAKRGCYVMLSNSNAPLIKELYADFNIHQVLARRAINSKGAGRGKIIERLITNYDAQEVRQPFKIITANKVRQYAYDMIVDNKVIARLGRFSILMKNLS
jgi:DNA adenine methylase